MSDGWIHALGVVSIMFVAAAVLGLAVLVIMGELPGFGMAGGILGAVAAVFFGSALIIKRVFDFS